MCRKRAGIAKEDCYLGVYEQMQLSLQAVCAYSDAFPDAIEGKCDVLGEYIESYDDIDVDQEEEDPS